VNWLDTQTKEILQKAGDDKIAPSKAAEFALVLLRKGPDDQRLIEVIAEINNCNEAAAAVLAKRDTPITVNPDLTEEAALWGQFELVCCDAVSVFLRSEIIGQNDQSYLRPLFKKISGSSEFRPTTVNILQVPATESGDKFLTQFVRIPTVKHTFPIKLKVPFKKARIMEHWANRIGAQVRLESLEA
jgi:hypothetical protein